MAMSFGAGPLISLLVFLNLGDTWTLRDCRLVVLVGVVCMLPALCLMCFFDDDKTLAHHSEAIVPLLEEAVEEDAELAATPGQESSIPQEREPGRSFWTPTIVVPILLTSSDFLAALASGMTIKFFSLFFMQHLEFSPSAVSLLSVASPFGVSAASLAAQSVAKRVGRVQLNLMLRLVDVCLLVTMAKLPTTPGTATAVLVAVHLTRMAAANCSSPLLRSVLNQFVPKRHRGKVNAVDSVKMFSWSGSAALGGILVERLGFEGTFLVTAAIKLTAILPLLGVLRYVPDGFFAGGAARSKHAAPEPSPALAAGVTTSWPVNMAEGEGETSAEDDEQTMYSNGDAVSIHVPKATPTF